MFIFARFLQPNISWLNFKAWGFVPVIFLWSLQYLLKKVSISVSVGNKEELGNIDQIIDLHFSTESDWYLI